MAGLFATRLVDGGFEDGRVKPKTMKFVFVIYTIITITVLKSQRTDGWFGINIMCSIG